MKKQLILETLSLRLKINCKLYIFLWFLRAQHFILIWMSKISEQDIRKLASLSKLQLSEQEVVRYQKELNDIVAYIEQLSSADVEGLLPTSQVTGLKNVTRPDELIDYGVTPKELLKNAPKQQDNQFRVKRMIV